MLFINPFRLKHRRLAALALLPVLLWGGWLALDRAFPFPVERLTPPASVMVLGARDEPLRFFLARDQSWRFPVELEEVSGDFVHAVLASEDRYFFSHPGVNPVAIVQAALSNLRAGRVVRGGSTITMQVARLAEPKRRTVWGKLREAFRAVQLEARYSKQEILEFYVNMAPYGGNLVGVGAASWFYFGKGPKGLSLAESALLAGIPKAPNRYNPVKHAQAAVAARAQVLRAMTDKGWTTPELAQEAAGQEPPDRLKKPPLIGPHFCQMVLDHARGATRIRTTLDPRVQETVRALMRARLAELRAQGVENAAVVVEDVHTRAVLALAGSADYLDDARHGRINAATAPRSPGSALKPFLYALAFDEGVIGPGSQLLDIPITLGNYDPHNYDGAYQGRVEAAEALIHSLNAPAVRLLALVGVPRFHGLLLSGGLKSLREPTGHYGLALILGGGEVGLLELTNLYATLAQGGTHAPALLQTDDRLDELDQTVQSSPAADTAPASPTGQDNLPGQALAAGHPDHTTLARQPSPATQPGMPGQPGRPDAPATLAASPPGSGQGRRLLSAEACALTTDILARLQRPDLPGGIDRAKGVPAVAWKTGTSFGHRDALAVGYSSRYAVGVWTGNVSGRPVKGISGAKQAAPLLFDIFRALEPDGAGLPNPEGLNVAQVEVCAESRQLPGPDCRARLSVPVIAGVTRLAPCTVHRRVMVDSATGLQVAGSCLAGREVHQEVVTEYPPELVSWWLAGGMAVPRPPLASPDCPEALAGQGPRITSPKSQAAYNTRPDAPPEFQRVSVTAQAGTAVRELAWFQDGVLLAKAGPEETIFLELTPGKHRLVVVDEQGRSDTVRYSVE